MKIAIITSEAIPFSKTGGLADVTGSLYREYLKMGHEAFLITPLYRKTFQNFKNYIEETRLGFDIYLAKDVKHCRIFRYKKNEDIRLKSQENIFFIENEEFFDREELYGDSSAEYEDNAVRFAFFCRSSLELIKNLDLKFDIIHCNDWQTGLIPIYLKTIYSGIQGFKNIRTVFTIHNLAYQGLFPSDCLDITGLGNEIYHMEGIEFYGKISYLKAGIISADVITTVSDSYAKEFMTPEFGFSMDGILRKRADRVHGIINGISYKEWDPGKDPYIAANYNRTRLSGKIKNKEELLKRCSIKGDTDKPLLSFIGRLSYQKGIELIISSLDESFMKEANIVIIGNGKNEYQGALIDLKERFPDSVFFYNGFDESFAHLTYAGADVFLMPSRYEPCGLGQMIAMRYGTIPVARKTGGLNDTIEDGKTGFLFDEFSKEAFSITLKIAINSYKFKKLWHEMVKKAMGVDFSWKKSAEKYLSLYSELHQGLKNE